MRPALTVPMPPLEEEYRAILTSFQQYYHHTLLAHPSWCDYLHRQRGIAQEGIRLCGLGLADGSAMQTLLSDPQRREEARAVGLLSAIGQECLWQRLVLPECQDGHCHWMIGRILAAREGRTPKYLGLSLSKPLLGYGLALQWLREGHPVMPPGSAGHMPRSNTSVTSPADIPSMNNRTITACNPVHWFPYRSLQAFRNDHPPLRSELIGQFCEHAPNRPGTGRSLRARMRLRARHHAP